MAGRRIGIVWNPAKTEKDDLVAALPDDPDLSVSWYETEEDDPGKSAAKQAIADGNLSMARIDESVARIIALKIQYPSLVVRKCALSSLSDAGSPTYRSSGCLFGMSIGTSWLALESNARLQRSIFILIPCAALIFLFAHVRRSLETKAAS